MSYLDNLYTPPLNEDADVLNEFGTTPENRRKIESVIQRAKNRKFEDFDNWIQGKKSRFPIGHHTATIQRGEKLLKDPHVFSNGHESWLRKVNWGSALKKLGG